MYETCITTVNELLIFLGIRYDHDEFEGRAKYDFFDPLDEEDTSNQQGMDCNGHGTHVAALAAGETYGVAKGATVYIACVFLAAGDQDLLSMYF